MTDIQINFIKKIDVPGYNGCLLNHEGTWYGTSRFDSWENDFRNNQIIFMNLDNNYNVCSVKIMKDITNRPIYRSYTKGPEDSRFIDSSRLISVTLDTNTNWKPQLSILTMDNETKDIIHVLPMRVTDISLNVEKNWLFLKENDTELTFLHSSFPFRIINVNKTTGEGYTTKFYETSINIKAHNGSILLLPDGNYLLTVRVKEQHNYKHSLFCILDSEFNLTKISKPFKFDNSSSYEMCMSMTIVDENIVCCVGIDDLCTNIYNVNLESVINNCKPI